MAAFALGKSGQSASRGTKMGPAQGTKLYSVTKKTHPGLLSKSLALDTGSCDAPIPAGFFPGRLMESEIADWATGPLMATSRQQNLRVTMLFHSITQYE